VRPSPQPSPRGRGSFCGSRLPVADRGEALFAADLVDDLQYPLAIGAELDAEFLHHPGIVDHEVAAEFPAAGFLVEGDLCIGQELAHEVGNLAEADRLTAGVVD